MTPSRTVRAGIASRRPLVKLAAAQPKGKAKPVTDQDIARLRDENARLREQINQLNEARRRAASHEQAGAVHIYAVRLPRGRF